MEVEEYFDLVSEEWDGRPETLSRQRRLQGVCTVQVENLDHIDMIKCRKGREINQNSSLKSPSNSLGFCFVLMFSYCIVFIHISAFISLVSNEKKSVNVFVINVFRLWVFGHELEWSPQSNFGLYVILFST